MCRDLRNLNIATEFGLNFTIWMNNNQSTFQENDFLMILKRQMKTITKMQLALILISLIIERNLLNKLNALRTENKKSHNQNSKNNQILFTISLQSRKFYSASEGKCSNDAGLDAYLKVETIKKCITTQHKMLIDLDQMNMKDIYLQVLPSFNGTQRNA